MRLSERGAIRRAIAEGGIHLYPAGRLMDFIKGGLSGDELRGNFDKATTAEKVTRADGPEDANARKIFQRDIGLISERLSKMEPDYDIESVFDRMMEAAPAMAKRYYGLDEFEAPRPKVLEYYFEGFSELYKDGDWFAFNVNHSESKEMNVPIGTYFKRDQVTPGHPELVSMHEANHAMQERAFLSKDGHHYVPWLDEGMADAFARMMLVRATGDWKLMELLKRLRTEIEVMDPRKATYHFGEETVILMLMRGRLPFAKAMMSARKREPYSIDYGLFGQAIRAGVDPHIALVQSYKGHLEKSFLKKMERDETKFRKEADFDGTDLKALAMFLASERPACLEPSEFTAALWISERVTGAPKEQFIPSDALPKAAEAEEVKLVTCSEVPDNAWEKTPGLETKVVVRESSIPDEHKAGIAKLAAKYFVVKKEVAGEVVYDPYGGGLPHRLSVGEIRCSY
jgi:hypothetical protein